MSYRFWPLADSPKDGILSSGGNCKPVLAAFYTPEQAKALAQRKERKDAA